MKIKLVCFILVPLFAFLVVLPLPASAVAAGAVVTAGEAMQAAEIFDFLVDSGLVEVDQLGTYFTPSLFLRTVSGTLDYFNVPVETAPDWLTKIFDINNQLFWNNDKSGVVQQHNGEIVPVNKNSDIWFKSDNMDDIGNIPINYTAQLDTTSVTTNNKNYDMSLICSDGYSRFGSHYLLPICVSGSKLYYNTNILQNSFLGTAWYYQYFTTSSLAPIGSASKVVDITPSYYSTARVGVAVDVPSKFLFQLTTLQYQDNWLSIPSQGNFDGGQGSWASASDNSVAPLTSGIVSYLLYTQEPFIIPPDFPDGNFVYNPDPANPDKLEDTVIVSPDSDFGNLFDFLQNGFQFTGKIESTIDNTVKFSGSLSADINANHSGNVSINITYPDQKFWAAEGSATDFGNGVTLDGNAFNDGFNWLINSVKAVPAVLASFTFIPAPVIAIMSAALVCMVFLGFWRRIFCF